MPDNKECKSKTGGNDGEKKLKPCCACPETKKVFSVVMLVDFVSSQLLRLP